MNKGLKILAVVLAVLTVGAGVAFFVTRPDSPKQVAQTPHVYDYAASDYTAAVQVLGQNGEVYLPTDLSGVYCTAALDGSVKFYDYANGAMTPSALAAKTVKAKLNASYESIPVTVHYVERDGKVTGFGVFTSDMDKSVDVYAFAFVKLCNKPAGYGSGHLLLADFNKNDLYRVNKTYSEIYSFNLAKGSTSTYVSNNTRLIDLNGSFRQDWTMLTDQNLRDLGSSYCFLSSRYYSYDETGIRTDVMEVSGNLRPKIVVKDFLGLWFVSDANGMHYLRKTADGFANILNAGGKEQTLTPFEGDWQTDYLQDGRWLLNKKSLQLTDLMTGAVKTLKGPDCTNAAALSVSPDGEKAVIAFAGVPNENSTVVQTLAYCRTDGDAVVFTEPLLYEESADFLWLDGNTVMSARALAADGAAAGSVCYAYPAE
ncbi:MAG: hypothetical protein IJK64_11565 [Clostridia bacterium]|nr:hypothetical protein [Clostridia bacterium]